MANRWTEEQQYAIDVEGNNVIVSAGAGSGKTAVLSERVLRKVKGGTHINELLILTFTKAAAQEMKDRIRKKLISNNLMDEVELIDGAYITTFDSYSLAIVKKYYYVLGISPNIKISDAVQLEIIKRDILDSIMEKRYKGNDDDFRELVCKFSLKDDKELIEILMMLSNKLSLKYDRYDYLSSYMDNYYSDEAIKRLIDEYLEIIEENFTSFKENELLLESLLEDKKLYSLKEKTSLFINSKSYEEIYNNLSLLELPRAVGYSDEAKEVNERLKVLRDELKKFCIYENTDCMYNEIMATYNDTRVIIDILLELDQKFKLRKSDECLYDFNDISHLAIRLVQQNVDIREEIRSSFKEILIDEYQDTSDTQEAFISTISNHNVYMVGDIKQSIYRFRNANPYIFKNKYDTYSKDNSKGYKIDLNKNFRSREEVLTNINMLFESVMDDLIGGADYRKSHQAIFGNASYNKEGKTIQNYDLVIKTYTKDQNITDVEQEAFIIARDIKKKILSEYQIFDKDTQILRKATYNDFVILMDKKKNFDLYKKIFEYLGIPLTVYREEKINNTDDFLVIHSLFKLILLVFHNDYGIDFKYSFMSLARSFLFNYSDDEIFTIFKDKSFKSTDIVKKALELKEEIEYLPLRDIFRMVLLKYNYYEMMLTTTDIVRCEKCIEYLDNLISSMGGADIEEFMYYLDKVIERDFDIKYDQNVSLNDSVKIMSIHKSKGLEFSICYFADLQNKFNMRDQKEKVVFNNQYGLILPVILDDSKETIKKILYKRLDTREEVSERIRLFYVALTRCKEHMIFVCPEVLEDNSKEEEIISSNLRMKYTSFYSILKSIWYKLGSYIEVVDNNEYSKDYLYKIKSKAVFYQEADDIKVTDVDFKEEKLIKEKYSKNIKRLQTKEERELLDFGTNVHQILEQLDFRRPVFDDIEVNNFLRRKIKNFLNSDIIKNNLEGKIYKEYEFITYKSDEELHGVIDLMIENDDNIIIIDYKLKDIDDKSYVKQLNGYKNYIEEITDKKVDVYLYSIMDEKFKHVCSCLEEMVSV